MIIKLNNEMSKLLLEEVEDAQSLISSQRKLDSDVKRVGSIRHRRAATFK